MSLDLPSLLATVEQALGSRITACERLSGSIVNHVFALRCDRRRLVLKCGTVAGIERESAVLAMLRPRGIPVPEVVPSGAGQLRGDTLLMVAWEGEAATPDGPAIAEAGRVLHRVHRLELPDFGPPAAWQGRVGGTHATWAGFLSDSVEAALAAVPDRVLESATRRAVLAELARHREHLDGIRQGVLLHGDLVPKHAWSRRGHLVGLIDWGDALVGDPLYDLARFSMAGEQAWRSFLAGYAPTAVPDPRLLALYRLCWAVQALGVECGAGGDWTEGYVSTIRRELDQPGATAG